MSASAKQRQRPVWAFIVLLGIVASLATSIAGNHAHSLVHPPFTIGLWLVILLAGLGEWFMFEIHYRSDSHTFSLSELTLTLGMAFVTPQRYLFAQVLGLSVVFILRKATPIRAAFNIVQMNFTAAVALTLTHNLAGANPNAQSPRTWMAMLAGLVVAAPISSILVGVVRSISERTWLVRDATRIAFFTQLNSIAVGTIGILLIATAEPLPWVAPLTLVPLLLAYTAFRLYVHEHSIRENTEFLYEATKTLQGSTGIDTAFTDVLKVAGNVFRAEFAMIAIARPDGNAWLRFTSGVLDPTQSIAAPAWIPDSDEAQTIMAIPGTDQAALLRELGASTGLVRRLRADGRTLGLFIVGQPSESAPGFNDKALYLFDLLANQIAVSLENTHLERSLNQLTRLEEELRHQANHDTLTGLANRALLGSALASSSSVQRTVLLIDLDDFKTINDSLGHAAGDAVLVEVANRLRSCVRSNDLVSRLGGDEFAVLLESEEHDTTLQLATETAARIGVALEPPLRVADNDLVVRGSIGVAYVEPGQSLGDALRNADVAMYEAKRQGKGTLRVFESSMAEAALEKLHIVNGLRSAIERNELELHYQPIVDLQTNECVAVESLLRWNHPELGLVPPDRFISAAEESGLIVEIGLWALRQACHDLKNKTMASGAPLRFAVNVAVRQLLEPTFSNAIIAIMGEESIDPRRLTIEITETTALTNSTAVLSAVKQVRDIGVQLALDDFGTGYSSLASVHGFPLDLLKIDKLFISTGDLSLARAIVALAKSLNLTAVAEGVETEQQIDELVAVGCNLAQGFAFSRPVTIEQLATTLLGPLGPKANLALRTS
jgi:diguanylate cyclase (GGDEF)-like protein